MIKTAIITGASRGIGAALAKAFARSGYHLSICCHNSKSALEELADELRLEYSIEVLTFVGDVASYDFVQEMISSTLSHFQEITVLINNAGISHVGLLTDMSISQWNHLVATNLTSVFSACRCVIPSMVQKKRGSILNISSVWGNVGASCEVAYSACKGGINAFTKALGKELAPSGITVNAIACGLIDTSMNACFSQEELEELICDIPSGRIGTPEDVASLALSLCSTTNYLTGQILTLDGGWI